MKLRTINIPAELHDQLGAIKDKTGIPIARLTRQAIELFIQTNYPEVEGNQ